MIDAAKEHLFKIRQSLRLDLIFQPKAGFPDLLQVFIVHLAIHNERQRKRLEFDFRGQTGFPFWGLLPPLPLFGLVLGNHA
ncbi:hypothetical protein D3C81_1004150 [compost metagenome]